MSDRYDRKEIIKGFPWSPYQVAIFDAIKNSDRNIIINAVAGAGKTTSIKGIVAHTPSKARVAALAFNRHNADNLAKVLPKNCTSTTVHAYAKTILTRFWSGEQPILDKYKYNKILGELVTKEYDVKKKQANTLVRYLIQCLETTQQTLIPLNVDAFTQMVNHFCIDYQPTEKDKIQDISTEQAFTLVRNALLQGQLQAENRITSFTDWLWLPTVWEIKPPQKEFLIVDEAQDANAAMRAIYKAIIQDGGRLIIMGDERQAIMGFAGSDADSWKYLKRDFDPLDLPLSVCYRCPTSHLDIARTIVPQIEARTTAPEGTLAVISEKSVEGLIKPQDLIICRFTAPLVELCLKLIVKGLVAKLRGVSLGESLADTVLSMDCEIADFIDVFGKFKAKKLKNYQDNLQVELEEKFLDECKAIEYFWEVLGTQSESLEEFSDRIKKLFTDENEENVITLSTVHRAKGCEAETVFLLGSNVLPYTFKCAHQWQVEQEINLQYVAITRSKQNLYLVPIEKKLAWMSPQAALLDPLGGMQLQEVAKQESVELPQIDLVFTPSTFEYKLNTHDWTYDPPSNQGDKAVLVDRYYYDWVFANSRESILSKRIEQAEENAFYSWDWCSTLTVEQIHEDMATVRSESGIIKTLPLACIWRL